MLGVSGPLPWPITFWALSSFMFYVSCMCIVRLFPVLPINAGRRCENNDDCLMNSTDKYSNNFSLMFYTTA